MSKGYDNAMWTTMAAACWLDGHAVTATVLSVLLFLSNYASIRQAAIATARRLR